MHPAQLHIFDYEPSFDARHHTKASHYPGVVCSSNTRLDIIVTYSPHHVQVIECWIILEVFSSAVDTDVSSVHSADDMDDSRWTFNDGFKGDRESRYEDALLHHKINT